MENIAHTKPIYSEIAQLIHKSNGHITPEVLGKMYAHGLFKCMLPDTLGGLNWGLQKTLECIEELSAIDGSLGWVVQIANGGTYFASCFTDEIARALFTPHHAVVAGSGAATGNATIVSGGYIVDGMWKYCSGSEHATIFTVNARTAEGIRSFTLLPHQIRIIPDWHTIGLKHTSTHTICAESQFVPDAYVFDLHQKRSQVEIPVFDYPFMIFAQLFFLSVQVGLIRRLIQETVDITKVASPLWTEIRESGVRKSMDQAISVYSETKNLMAEYATATLLTAEEQQDTGMHLRRMHTQLVQAAYLLFQQIGIEAVYATHTMSKIYLDMVCVGQHSMLREKVSN